MDKQEKPKNRWLVWVEMVYAPRLAWKTIFEVNPYSDYMLWLVLFVSSLVLSLPVFANPPFGFSAQPILLLLTAGFTFVIDIFSLFLTCVVLGAFAKWLGVWLGGSGGYQKTQAVLIWAGLPYVYVIFLWMIAILIGGKPIHEAYMAYANGGKSLIQHIMLIWLSILVGLGYIEAHGLSVKKGILLTVVTYVVPMLLMELMMP